MYLRRFALTATFASLLALGIATPSVAASPAEAASLMAVCRRQCRDEITACVSEGHRRAVCRREKLRRCKVEGVQVCEPPSGGGDITALVGGPTCVIQADTFVQQSDASKNYGTKSLLEIDSSPMQRTFIRIVVSGVGSGQQVTSARLRLKASDDDESNSGGRIHHQPGCGWNETTLTWNNHNSFPFLAGVLDSEGPVSEGQSVEFNLTPTVVTGNGTFCFVIDSLSSDGIDYNSREASSSKRPTCVVQVSAATTTTLPVTTTTSSTNTTTTTSTTTTTVRFVDNGDGTVTDNQMCLQWEKKDGAGDGPFVANPHDVDNIYNWGNLAGCAFTGCPNGTAYTDFLGRLNNCVSLDGVTVTGGFAGHCDWRLPTIAELQTILLAPFPCGTDPCIDGTFGPTATNYYWSSTTIGDDALFAWLVYFGNGNRAPGAKATVNISVRAVRGGSCCP